MIKGLAHMVGDHIIRTAHPSSGGDVLALCQKKLGVCGLAVTPIAGYQPAEICLLRIRYIVDNIADGSAFGTILANV